MKNKFIFFLMVIVAFNFFLRLPAILNSNFAFVFDMGRDMLWVRDMVVLGKIYLIGPWGSLAGIFFGPFWYYFLAPFFILSGGDPRGSVFLCFLSNLIILFLVYFLGKKLKNERLGLIFAFLITISPLMISLSTFAFHANLLPLTTLLLIWSFYEFLNGKKNFLILASLATSLNFHFEPATAIFTSFTFLLFLLWQRFILKDFKKVFWSFFAFLLPFIPQIIFELRHQFIQTQALLNYLKGINQSLGGQLPLILRFLDRQEKILRLFASSIVNLSSLKVLLIFLLFLLLISLWLLWQENSWQKKFIKVNLMVFLVPIFGFIFLFSPELKNWYLYGLVIPLVFLWGLVLEKILEKNQLGGFLILFFLIYLNTQPLFRFTELIGHKKPLLNPETLAFQKQVIDWIYSDAQKTPFAVYIYTPPVYDYHYQYLFWWLGQSYYNYWPEEYSYLPTKVDYVPNKEKYLILQNQKQKKQNPIFIYLIIEPDKNINAQKEWLVNFIGFELINKKKFDNGLIVEKRKVLEDLKKDKNIEL